MNVGPNAAAQNISSSTLSRSLGSSIPACKCTNVSTAYRMQTEAPEVFDIRKETEATQKLYGPGSTARGA